MHPLESGMFRRKYRRDRRRGLATRTRCCSIRATRGQTASKHWRILRMYLTYRSAYRRALRPAETAARDVATESLAGSELNALDLFNVTAAARSAVEKVRQRASRRAATDALPGDLEAVTRSAHYFKRTTGTELAAEAGSA